jgi:hypothetical protein
MSAARRVLRAVGVRSEESARPAVEQLRALGLHRVDHLAVTGESGVRVVANPLPPARMEHRREPVQDTPCPEKSLRRQGGRTRGGVAGQTSASEPVTTVPSAVFAFTISLPAPSVSSSQNDQVLASSRPLLTAAAIPENEQ